MAVSPGMMHNQKIPFRGKADEIVSFSDFLYFVAVTRQAAWPLPLPQQMFTDSDISHVMIM